MNWIPPQYVDALAATAGFAGTEAELRDVLRRIEDLGADEVQLIPDRLVRRPGARCWPALTVGGGA